MDNERTFGNFYEWLVENNREVRNKTIEEMAIRLLNEMDNMNIQRTVMNVVKQMKEGAE